MTDKELLELAAKSVHFNHNEYDDYLGLGLCTKNGIPLTMMEMH
jgi:hypothetical protein